MAPRESQKRASLKWDKENMITLGCKIKREQAAAFKSYCENQGKTSNTVLKEYVMNCIGGGAASETAGKPAGAAQGAGVVSLTSETLEAAQRAAETGKGLVPADKEKAVKKLFGILGDLSTVDLDKARCECLGIVYLSPETLEAAQQAAEAAGEVLPDFVTRAVETQARRDQSSLRLGINPATGVN